MKRIEESGVRKKEKDDEKSLEIWDCGSPLYDAHELVAVSHVVERHLMILPHLSGSRFLAETEISRSEKTVATTSVNAGRSSVLGFFSKTVWKRKTDGEIKQKAKKQKTMISKFFAWKKK
ncbi:hypothetical protein C2S52_011194 [Perilla frutescens var. hirtella]|nr:hypothetical protein C2S52_011194 [Perilla frutescens var. hirtella]KAH6786111.1 hypothetical protein C2S51_038566 [Perilla frutescens var. frutescens]